MQFALSEELAKHIAVLHGHAAAAQLLLERGASLEVVDGLHRLTPLSVSRLRGHRQVADVLFRAAEEKRGKRLANVSSGEMVAHLSLGSGGTLQGIGPALRPARLGVWNWTDALALVDWQPTCNQT